MTTNEQITKSLMQAGYNKAVQEVIQWIRENESESDLFQSLCKLVRDMKLNDEIVPEYIQTLKPYTDYVSKVSSMREAQKSYFRTRNTMDLSQSKSFESIVDQLTRNLK